MRGCYSMSNCHVSFKLGQFTFFWDPTCLPRTRLTWRPLLRKMTFLLQYNAMKWKDKWFPSNVMRDSVMLKRDFGRNLSVIHHGPSFQQVKNTLYMYNIQDFIFYFRTCSFTILWIAINGLGARIRHRKSVSWMRNWVGNLLPTDKFNYSMIDFKTINANSLVRMHTIIC